MSAKSALYNQLITFFGSGNDSFTVQDCIEFTSLKRTLINHYLNRLCEDGLLTKTKNRPVRYSFSTPESSKKNNQVEVIELSTDISAFDEFIGARGSLADVIESCKAAVCYPDGGLPLLICGESGVGKSFLASLIHRYAQQEEVISSDAPFVVLNCADYANNPELLSATLFGYIRGAFTGADKEKKGLLDQADGGVVFLDEVHRLSPENQEKLFMLMDKGTFNRLGDNVKLYQVRVRFIFATTENVSDVLLPTLLRRIPFHLRLTDFSLRPLIEKLTLIQFFFQQEARKLKTDLRVSNALLEQLIHFSERGNIGGLKNKIKVLAASAFTRYRLTQETLYVGDESNQGSNLIIRRDTSPPVPHTINQMIQARHNYSSMLQELCLSGNIAIFRRKAEVLLLELSGGLTEQDLLEHWVWNKFSEAIKIFFNTTGINITQDINRTLFYCLLCTMHASIEKEHADILASITEESSKSSLLSNELINILGDYFTDVDMTYLPSLFNAVFSTLLSEKDIVQGVIICHGASTASSIASTANNLLSGYYFKAFDMSQNVSTQAIIDKLLDFIDSIKRDTGLIILVDMGSLQEIYKEVKLRLNGDLLVVNNVFTGMALDIGSKIQQGLSVRDIASDVANNYKIEARYYHGLLSGNKLIISCISGEGISKRLKEIFNKYINNEHIEIITMEYDDLKWKLANAAEALNGTKLIITTTDLDCGYIPQINVQKLLREKKDVLQKRFFAGILDVEPLQTMLDEIVKFYTIEGVSTRLNFLNPKIIIDEVDGVIQAYEAWFGIHFESYPRMNLFMHIALMVERLMLGSGATRRDDQTLSPSQQVFVDLQPEFFEKILTKYHINLTMTESLMIYEIMESWIKKDALTSSH
ncbi:sigma 54-interacting transcriptional regulator [Buttiauxella sp. S04-F03]|uniref:sigma 54-interacting transcriptional regulator n=1 Tax=Buttiauxella sp. W03-F01 TaxID=2904524 RepID=UPI001E2F7CF0|nr:sigma 54-interacting transcriptional regulator [Buttiauxella sp. W03-F01]MCE0799469.1 sigma 54-interacting transcriptional regulator [Buttiauxella sp. W03-F01]